MDIGIDFDYSSDLCQQVHLKVAYAHSVKPVLNSHSKKDQKLVFRTDYSLMQVKSIAECSKRAFFIRPALSYNLSLRPLFCLFLSGHLKQVLLHVKSTLISCADISLININPSKSRMV